MEKPLFNYMKESFDNLGYLLGQVQIVGEPISLDDGGVLLPISQVSFGFGSGGVETKNKKKNEVSSLEDSGPLSSVILGGVTMKPKAFLYMHYDECTVIYVEKDPNVYQKALDLFLAVLKKKKKL